MKNRSSVGERLFDTANIVLLVGVALLCLLPFLHVVAKSFSDQASVMANKIILLPSGLNVKSYMFLFTETRFFSSLRVTIIVTIVGTLLAMMITLLAAYPLSKPDFKGRKIILLLYVFSMLFYGGIIPSYILIKGLGLLNTIWAMILPLMVVPFNLLVCKTFLEGLPESLDESAKMDGASNMRTLISIVLPISLPIIATLGVFYAVGYWNNYFHPVLFISKISLNPLQVFVYDMISSTNDMLAEQPEEVRVTLSPEGLRASTVIASVLPILLVYPFLQRYFIHGMTLGSVKG